MGASSVGVGLLLIVAAAALAEARAQESFIPLVAFKCGFRNQYMSEDGTWKSDETPYATCMSGKLDILKYCQKKFPALNVSNIVEYGHYVKIDGWCDEKDAKKCERRFEVQPFHCLEGEFHSEALQVPRNCSFNHVLDKKDCNDFAHWQRVAEKHCRDNAKSTQRLLRSFAMLEPCGLDMFTGVEFVCCDRPIVEKKLNDDDDEDDDDDDDDDEYDDDEDDDEYDEDEAKKKRAKGSSSSDATQDPYFREIDTANEHANFQAALARLEKKHHEKISKVVTEWHELEQRYQKMKAKDPQGADTFNTEMKNRFQRTVAALEDETRAARKQLEAVHDERVQNQLNERKREATHAYREALARQVGSDKASSRHEVLRTLKSYIRTEEKDRRHMLGRYRRMLHHDKTEASRFRPLLLHHLRYIDLRINGTLAMLRDFPTLDKALRPIALAFWSDLRKEQTPDAEGLDLAQIEHDAAELQQQSGSAPPMNQRLVDLYKDAFDEMKKVVVSTTTTPRSTTTTTRKPTTEKAKVLSSDEGKSSADEDDDDEYYEDENDEEVKKTSGKIKTSPIVDKKKKAQAAEEPAEKKKQEVIKKVDIKQKKPALDANDDDEDEWSDEEDEDDEELRDKAQQLKSLRVSMEPIVEDARRRAEAALFRLEEARFVDYDNEGRRSLISWSSPQLLLVGAATLLLILIAALVIRRRASARRHRGFIEVDVCTPDEAHVNGMQINGYENPTYSFFDAKA